MNKKKIIIISVIAAIVLIAGIVSGIYFLGGDKQKNNSTNQDDFIVGEELLKTETSEAFNTLVDKYSLEVIQDFDWHYVKDVSLFDRSFNIDLRFDGNSKTTDCKAYTSIGSTAEGDNKVSAEELKSDVNSLLYQFTNFFGETSYEDRFFIFDMNGSSIDKADNASYQKILNGEAYLELNVRESETSFWRFTIKKTTGTETYCLIDHYINDPEFKDLIGDINLYS